MKPQSKHLRNRKVRIGVVGAGHIANSSHLPVLVKLPRAEVTAVCDKDEDAAQRVIKRFKIPKFYVDLAQMLEKEQVDVIDILTPSDTHADLVTQAMQHGCHCLMEKPLSVSTTDADRVINVAEETGLGLFVTHNWSFFPVLRRAKAMAASGALGEVIGVDVQYLTSFGEERYSDPNHWCHRLPGGIFADISPHLAMVLLDFLENVRQVKAITRKLSDYPHIVADELKVMVEARNGLGSFTLSFNSPVRQFAIYITGTKMCLSVNANTQIIVRHKPIARHKSISSITDGIPRGAGALSEIFQQVAGLSSMAATVILGKHNYLEGHRYLIEAALNNVRGEGTYPVNTWKCREVVRILEEAFNSAK